MYRKIHLFFIFIFLGISASSQNTVNEALAYQYYQNAEYEKAASLFDELFNKSKIDSYFELYINSLLKIKKFNEAETSCKKLIRQYPQKADYQIALARTYQESDRTNEATKVFNQIIERFSTDEVRIRALANTFYRTENYDMAIKAFLHGRKVLKDEQAFGFELLSLYRFKRDKTALIEEYLNLLPTNPQWLMQAKSVFSSLFETKADYSMLQTTLLKKIQKEPQNEALNDLLTWQFIQQQEYEAALRQLIAQDRRTKSTASEIFNTAGIFTSNKAFGVAAKAYEYLIQKGTASDWYVPAKIRLINCQYELALAKETESASLQTLANEFSKIIRQYGINPQTLFAVKRVAHLQAYYLNQPDSAANHLEQALKVSNLQVGDIAALKIDLGDIYMLNQRPWDALLAYEQVAKEYENTNIGSEAKFRSARLSFYQGNFSYAKSQADVLKTSTSQLIANDALNLSLLISDNLQNKNDSLALALYAKAEMQQQLNKLTLAVLTLDSIDMVYPDNSLSDDILMAKSKIFIRGNRFQEAEGQLGKLISEHPESNWIDDAIFQLAELYETKLDKPEEARKLYKQLITDFPGSMLNNEARKRYRNLRGDNLGV